MSDAGKAPAARRPGQMPPLAPEQIDQVARALLALAREVWVLKDRQVVLEAVLAARGIDAQALIDSHVPDAALSARLASERDRMLGEVLAPFKG